MKGVEREERQLEEAIRYRDAALSESLCADDRLKRANHGDPDFDVVPPESKPEDVCPCCGATTEGGPGPMVRKFEPYEACCLVAGAGSSSSLAFSFQNGPKKVRVSVEEI